MSAMDQDVCLIKADNDCAKERSAHYNKLRLEGLFCDLIIVVEGKSYPAHRVVMATASEFFYAKLNGGSNRDDESKCTITLAEQAKVRGFEPLIEYAYTGVLTIKYSNIFDVSHTASYLQMFDVSSKIQSYYQQSVQQVHQMQQQQHQLGAHTTASAALIARLFNQSGLLPPHPHHPAAPHHPAHLQRMQIGAPASASPVQQAPNPAGLDAMALMVALGPEAGRFLPGMHRPQLAAHKPPPPEQQQIDPVQLQQMRRYAAEIRGTNLHHHQQQQQRFVQSMAAARPGKEEGARQMVVTGNETVRSNSADQVVMSKHSSAENGSPSPSSRNIDGSGETAEVRAKRGRSCDAVIQINGKGEGSLGNESANGSSTEKTNDEEASCSYDLTAPHRRLTPPTPSLLASKQAASPPAVLPNNGQLMALLQPHQAVNFANGCSDKAGKAIVDEFANNILSQNMGKQESYANLMKRFGGNENVISNLLKTHKQRATSWLQHQHQHSIFMKQHVGNTNGNNNNNSNANNNNSSNRSSSNGANQREVDLPDLPPSGRYSTVRRRTLQSNKPKPHECKICGSTFTRYHNLKQHVKLHSGIKPFQCKICFKRFTRNYTLKLHVDKHQNAHHQHRTNVGGGIGGVPSGLGAEYRCQVCLASFDDATSFEVHLAQTGHQQVIASPDEDDSVSIDEMRGYHHHHHHHYRPSHQYASSSSSPPSPQDMDDAVASAGAATTPGAFYSIRKDSMMGSPSRSEQQDEREPMVGGEGRNKVRYGLDSPGDSSGDTITNPGSNSPPRGGDSEMEDDESPTDLSVVKKRPSNDGADMGGSLQIDESAGQDLRTTGKKIKIEMSA